MPRIDPITGVPVMTQMEFWEAEGKLNNESASDAMKKFYDEFDKDREKFRVESLANLPNRIKMLCKEHPDDYPFVDDVIKIEDFRTSMGFRDTRIEARVLCKLAGGIEWLKYEYWSYLGSFYEPPGTDEWLGKDDVT
jgi:hypothetical protein